MGGVGHKQAFVAVRGKSVWWLRSSLGTEQVFLKFGENYEHSYVPVLSAVVGALVPTGPAGWIIIGVVIVGTFVVGGIAYKKVKASKASKNKSPQKVKGKSDLSSGSSHNKAPNPKVLKQIPARLKKSDGRIDLSKFDINIKGRTAMKESGGWQIVKDTGRHAGSAWKLLNKTGERIATLWKDGRIRGK